MDYVTLVISILTIIASGVISYSVSSMQIKADSKKWHEEREDEYRKMIAERKMQALDNFVARASSLHIFLLENLDDFDNEVTKSLADVSSHAHKLLFHLYKIREDNVHVLSDKCIRATQEYLDYFGKSHNKYEFLDMTKRYDKCINVIRDELGLDELNMQDGLGKFFKKLKSK